MTLALVRHAAPEIDPARPATAWRLSADGRTAAARLRLTLRVDAVVSSPEPKALETAAALDAPLEVDARLREHDRAGVGWLDDFAAGVEAGFARPDEVVLGAESFRAARERFAAAVADALAAHPGERLAVVSHGTVIARRPRAPGPLPYPAAVDVRWRRRAARLNCLQVLPTVSVSRCRGR